MPDDEDDDHDEEDENESKINIEGTNRMVYLTKKSLTSWHSSSDRC